MRVLLLSTDLRLGSRRGERALRLATALGAAGHDVEVFTCDAAEAGAATVTQVPDYPPLIEAWERSRWAMQFSSAVLERATASIIARGADVVHGHDWEISWAARAAARLAQVPLIATLHTTERIRTQSRYDDSPFIEDAERALCREAGAGIAPTRALADAMRPFLSRLDVIDFARASDARLVARAVAVYEHAIRRARPKVPEHRSVDAREQLG